MATDPGLSKNNFSIFKQYVPVATTPSGCITYNGTALSGAETFSTFSAPANGTCAAGSVEVGNVPIVPACMAELDQLCPERRLTTCRKKISSVSVTSITKRTNWTITPSWRLFSLRSRSAFELANISEYHTFSPTVTNEFRFGFNRFDENIVVGPQKYPGLDQFPNITLFDLGSGLNIGPDSNAPQFTVQNFYQFVDNVSWLKRQAQSEDRRRVPLVYFAAGVHATVSR